MKKIAVTGSAGWIGSHLCRELESMGYTVIAVDREYGVMHDLARARTMLAILDRTEPDTVINLAGQVGKFFCDQNPDDAIRDNVIATTHVARACASRGVPLIHCSTSEVYGDRGDEICYEFDDLSAPTSGMYAETKRLGEYLCNQYAPDGLKIIRPTMPYGPGVPPGPGRRALDNLVWQALTLQPMVVHRGGARSWCWIEDVTRGIIAVLERGEPGVYNVGRDDDEVSMHDLATIAAACSGLTPDQFNELIREVDGPPRQTLIKRLSTQKLYDLGWKPSVDLSTGINAVKDWLLANRALWPITS